jgi:hypothetical protein
MNLLTTLRKYELGDKKDRQIKKDCQSKIKDEKVLVSCLIK